jgi:VWFA-related protein
MVARILLSSSLIFSMLLPTFAQQPTPPPVPGLTPPPQQKTSEADSQDVLKITTNLVQIDVSVTKGEKVVTDLQPEDFEISEDGKLQSITNFSYVSNLPEAAAPKPAAVANSTNKVATPIPPAKVNAGDQRRVMALVVDDDGISWESMSRVKKQLQKLIDQLSPNDLIAIIRTDGDVGALQQFTNDKRVLQNALNSLHWNPCSRVGMEVFRPNGQIGPALSLCSSFGRDRSTKATLTSLDFILKGMGLLPGRKSLVLFSDEIPLEEKDQSLDGKIISTMPSLADLNTLPEAATGSLPGSGLKHATQFQRVIETAIRSAVVVYAVDTRGLQFTGLTAEDRPSTLRGQTSALLRTQKDREHQLFRGREGSDLIARRTGGFLIKNSNGFDLPRIMDDQQGYYLIGFRPTEETFDRKFHHLKVGVKRNGLTVRSRDGFFGLTSQEMRPPLLSAPDEMKKALGSPFGAKDVSMRLTTFFIDEDKGPLLRSFLYFDPHDLTFTDGPDGVRAASIEVKAMLFGDNGTIVEEANQRGSIGITPNMYERSSREGVIYSFDLPAKVGGIQFRVAVRDVASGRIGSAGQFVDIPNLQGGLLAMSGIVMRAATTDAAKNPFADDVRTGPAVRHFRQESTIDFGYVIYNANPKSELAAQARLYHDGKLILDPYPLTIGRPSTNDSRRVTSRGKLQLGSNLVPGDYVFQIIVTDLADKQKPRVASQWIDFEIVK